MSNESITEDEEIRITLHLTSDSDTCTKSVGTDLTMMDISNLEDLLTENTQLRNLISALEAKLRWREDRKIHKEKEVEFDDAQDEDSGDQLTVQELKNKPSLLTILKAEPNPTEITPSAHVLGDRWDLQPGDDQPRLPPAGQTGLTNIETKDVACENDCWSICQKLEDVASLSSACKTEPDLLEIPYTVLKTEQQQVALDPEAVTLENASTVQEPRIRDQNPATSGLPVDEWSEEMDRLEEKDKTRRHAEINKREIEVLEKIRNEEATVKQTMWAVRCFKTWCTEKNISVDFRKVTKAELNQTLRHFYATVRNGKGDSYGFSSYVGLRAGLNRHINEPPLSLSWYILKDPEFSTSNNVFLGVLTKLRREGQDKSVHYPAISYEDFVQIKNSEALNPNTPAGLVNKVWFDVQLHLGRRPKEGNRQLKPESFVIHSDRDGVKYASLTSKEATKNQKERARGSRRRFMYEQPGDALCPVASLKKYLSVLPPNPPAFYLHPKRTNDNSKVWYSREPMGVNFLGSMLPRICKAAGVQTAYTNHCLQSTTLQKLTDVGSEGREMMAAETGHHSDSSQRPHCHPNHDEWGQWSNALMSTTLAKRTCSEEQPSGLPAKKRDNTEHALPAKVFILSNPRNINGGPHILMTH